MRETNLTPLIPLFFILLVVIGSGTNVSVQVKNVQAIRGAVIQPYYINMNVPATSCNGPTVDTSTSQPATSGSFNRINFCLWTPQFTQARTLPSAPFTIDMFVRVDPRIDGSNIVNFNAASGTISFTTSSSDTDLIIVMISTLGTCSTSCVSGTDGAGNTIAFSQRAFQSNTVNLYEFYGFTTGVGTVRISIALSSNARTVAIAFGIAGANLNNPFDTSSAIASGTNNNPSVSTTVPNTGDLVLGLLGTTGNPTITAGPGYTIIRRGSSGTSVSGGAERLQSASSGTRTVSFTLSSNQNWVLIGEVIRGGGKLQFNGYITDSAGNILTTLFSGNTVIFTSNVQAALIIPITSSSIPASGYIELQFTSVGVYSNIFTFQWGSGNPSNFQVSFAYA